MNISSGSEVLGIESNRMDFVMRLPIKWSPVGFIIQGGKLFGNSPDSFGHGIRRIGSICGCQKQFKCCLHYKHSV